MLDSVFREAYLYSPPEALVKAVSALIKMRNRNGPSLCDQQNKYLLMVGVKPI